MKTQLSAVFILLLLSAFIFSFNAIQQGGTHATPEVISSKAFHKPVRDKQFFAATTETVPIENAYINKDTLCILTRKIPGCDVESFKLVWNGAFAKSLPPQTRLRLFKAAETDCSEKHKFRLTFHITPLRFKQDSTANAVTMVSIDGWNEPLKYEYDSIPPRQRSKK